MPVSRTGPARVTLRMAVSAVQSLRRGWWFVQRPTTRGARAIATTPAGRVVLVRHSYVPGWQLPGGGIARAETANEAALRELREEVGMTGHGAIRHLADFRQQIDFKDDTVSLFAVVDVRYTPALSLEIEAIDDFDPAALPDGTTPATRRRVREYLTGSAPPPHW